MFLKELWSFNKKGAITFLLFIFLWCFLNFKQGAVATPLLQYGMYSPRFYLRDTQNVLQLYIDKKSVDFKRYSTAERDRLQSYLEYYLVQKKNNEDIFKIMHRILGKGIIGRWMKNENYTNKVTDECFSKWYKKMIEDITGQKINQLEAFQQKYTWNSNLLVPVGPPVKVNCIVAY